jgi:hypothetical protein
MARQLCFFSLQINVRPQRTFHFSREAFWYRTYEKLECLYIVSGVCYYI